MLSNANSAQLTALADLISDNVKTIIAQYSAAGRAVPALDSTISDPFDAPEASPPALAQAVRTIEAACAQLTYTIASPGHTLTNKTFAHYEVACLLVVCDAKIADLLLDKPEGVHTSELAKQSGIEEGKLGRVLRLLATKHCFNEVKPNVFANNRLSMKLLSTDPVSGLIGHGADELARCSPFLSEVLSDPATATSYSPNETAFVRAHQCAIFDFHSTPEGKKRNDRFARAMAGWGEVTGAGSLPKVYPWAALPQGSTICDVGGGNGQFTLELMKAFPGINVVVQDIPTVIEQGKELWYKEYPTAIQNSKVKFVPFNFFEDAAEQGCDFYYVRHVIHDWPDVESLKILNNVRKAMRPSSRLLIHEFVLQHVTRDDPNLAIFDVAPAPLLPNYGVANVRRYQQDINMMAVFNSKERTVDQFIDLGTNAGFKLVKIWDSGETALLEFALA